MRPRLVEIDIDARRRRAQVHGVIVVPKVDRVEIRPPRVILDTGSDQGLIAPRSFMKDLPTYPCRAVHGLGGGIAEARHLVADVMLPDGLLLPRVGITVLDDDDCDGEWFSGLPVLAEFNLLLVPDEYGRRLLSRQR